jgi:hypothetical protein
VGNKILLDIAAKRHKEDGGFSERKRAQLIWSIEKYLINVQTLGIPTTRSELANWKLIGAELREGYLCYGSFDDWTSSLVTPAIAAIPRD